MSVRFYCADYLKTSLNNWPNYRGSVQFYHLPPFSPAALQLVYLYFVHQDRLNQRSIISLSLYLPVLVFRNNSPLSRIILEGFILLPIFSVLYFKQKRARLIAVIFTAVPLTSNRHAGLVPASRKSLKTLDSGTSPA